MKIQDKSGMTLVEVMVVIAILLILAAFAVPEAIKAKPNFELRSLAHDVLATMQRARSLAVQHNTDVHVEFSDSGCKVIEVGSSADPIELKYGDYGYSTRSTGDCGKASKNWDDKVLSNMTKVVFNSRGTAQADPGPSGTIYLENDFEKSNRFTEADNRQCYAITTLSTGIVKLRKYNHSGDAFKSEYWLD